MRAGARMKWIHVLAAIILISSSAAAQSSIPIGTLVPVSLSGSLSADRVHAGQQIRAEVMQDIPGTTVKRRAHLLGHVVSAFRDRNGHAHLEIAFDSLVSHGQRILIKTDLRAIASLNEVQEAQIPEEGASRGITPEVATTTQIGGDQVYRGGGPVASGETIVGRPTPWGVVAKPREQLGTPCRGVVNNNTQPQAFWLFSTDACGVYGLSKFRIEHAGRSNPAGKIILASRDGGLQLRSGTALLLRVVE